MKRSLWLTWVVLLVLLTACSGEPTQPSGAAASPSDEIFQMALPRLVVDLDENGVPSIMGINPLFLKAVGVDVSGFSAPPELVKTMQQAGVQHIELAAVGDRLVILVNGKPMPQLGFSEGSLQRALDLASLFGVQNTESIAKLVPWVTRLGLNVVLRFPRGEAAEIPLSKPGTAKELTISPVTDAPSLVTKFEVKFDQDGTPGILGFTANDLTQLTGADIGGLAPETLGKLQAGNVQHLEVRNKPNGLHLYVNGQPLPTLTWDTQLLKNLVEVYGQLQPDGAFKPLVDALLPTLDRADIGIMLHFPVAAGAEAIPVKMHE